MSNTVWSVNILLGLGLICVGWIIYIILLDAHKENVSIQDKKDQQDH